MDVVVQRFGLGIFAAGIVLAGAGCGQPDHYYPSEVGTKWTYDVRSAFGATHVEEVEVARRLSVAGTEGFELSGGLGVSRLAWKRGVLWGDTFANVRAQPPLPLLSTDKGRRNWEGTLETVFGREKARATLTHQAETKIIAGRKFDTLRAELSIERPLGTTSLITWYVPGLGIGRQEQRTRGTLELRVEWVAGPS